MLLPYLALRPQLHPPSPPAIASALVRAPYYLLATLRYLLSIFLQNESYASFLVYIRFYLRQVSSKMRVSSKLLNAFLRILSILVFVGAKP